MEAIAAYNAKRKAARAEPGWASIARHADSMIRELMKR